MQGLSQQEQATRRDADPMVRNVCTNTAKTGTAQGQPRDIIHFLDKIDKVD